MVSVTISQGVEDSSIYSHLRQAAEAVEAASVDSLSTAAAGYLEGVEELLIHHPDGAATGAEALMYPTASALDTVQDRLAEIIDDAEGPAVEHLETARAHIIQAILLLDEQESQGRPASSWR